MFLPAMYYTYLFTTGRLTDPNDVANMCLYLGSDEGKFVTGINLEIDGGRAVGA